MKKDFIISLMDELIQQLDRAERKIDVLIERSVLKRDGLLISEEVSKILNVSLQELSDLRESGQIDYFVGKGGILEYHYEHLEDFFEEYDNHQDKEEGGPEDDWNE